MKLLIFIALLCSSMLASAQNSESYNKGKKVIGADFSGSYSNDGNYEFLTASTTPEFGYFIHNNLALGVTMNLEYLYQMGYTRVNGLQSLVGPFAKYYFNNGIFASVNVCILYGLQKSESPTITFANYKSTDLGYSISPGIGYAYFLANNVALESCIQYNMLNYTTKKDGISSNNSDNSFGLKIGFRVFL